MKRKIAMLILCLTTIACAFSLSACSETKSLTIYVDGEVYQTVEFEGMEFVDLPALAERLGYEFIGWQLDGGDIIVDGRINADQAGSSQSIHAVWNFKTNISCAKHISFTEGEFQEFRKEFISLQSSASPCRSYNNVCFRKTTHPSLALLVPPSLAREGLRDVDVAVPYNLSCRRHFMCEAHFNHRR